MKKHARHAQILQALIQEGEVGVEALARRFDVSVMTVRRDLAEMAAHRQVRRTHGGAVPARAGVIEFTVQDKAIRRGGEKRAIARAAASLITAGMAVSLDTGTTTLEVARAISGVQDVTVLTASLAIASILYAQDGIELVLLGGNVRKNSPDLMGPLTEENLKRFRVHLAVLGADAVTPDGIFTTDVRISRVSRAMVENAHRTVLVADSSKFMQTAFCRFASLKEVHHVITDDACAPAVREWLDRAVETVTYVSAETPGRDVVSASCGERR